MRRFAYIVLAFSLLLNAASLSDPSKVPDRSCELHSRGMKWDCRGETITLELRGGMRAVSDKLRSAWIRPSAMQAKSRIKLPLVRSLLDASSWRIRADIPENVAVVRGQEAAWFRQTGIRFQENRGQLVDTKGHPRPEILYTAEVNGTRLYFTRTGVSTVFVKNERKSDSGSERMFDDVDFRSRDTSIDDPGSLVRTYRMDMDFEGCNPGVEVLAESETQGESNYYYAHCPDGILGVKEFGRITYTNLWDNIDAVFYSVDGKYKYDFIVRPGGDPSRIGMRYTGAKKISLDEKGRLLVETPFGSVEEHAPVSYQDSDASISSSWSVDGTEVSIAIGDYDPTRTLVIDPWATYYGGGNSEYGYGVSTDANGNVFVCGKTQGGTFPFQSAVQGTYGGGNYDAFVVKFDGNGNRQWATFYGGSSDDIALSIACDGNGNAALTGSTTSTNFPLQNACQGSLAGSNDAFVVQLNGSGQRQWATYYGGSDFDRAFGIAVDANGNVCISGETSSSNFPVLNAFQSSQNTTWRDAFVVKLSGSGVPQWSTYLGGSDNEWGAHVATDANGNVIVAGGTLSSDFPVYNAAQSSRGGTWDAFVMKFNSNGQRLWGTFYGGSSTDYDASVAVDGSGNVFICGNTRSTNLPVLNAFQSTLAGESDYFLVKYNSGGALQWATYYGGSLSETTDISRTACAADGSGNVVMAGQTRSTNFPVYNALQGSNAGGYSDAVVVKFDGNGVRQWATYIGGNQADVSYGITTDAQGNVIFTGRTGSTNFPVQNAFQASHAGDDDVFVVQLTPGGTFGPPSIQTSALPSSTLCPAIPFQVSFTTTGTFNSGNTFTAQLSNPTGSFSSPEIIGSLSGTSGGSINCILRPSTVSGSQYRIRVIASNPATEGSDNGSDLTVYPNNPTSLRWTGQINAAWSTPGNWDNPCAIPTAGDTVVIPGGMTPPQTIPPMSLSVLELDNAFGTALADTLTITGKLKLINGHVQVGSRRLRITTTGSILGGSANSYVVVNDTGRLCIAGIGSGSKTDTILFPIGSSAASYTPVKLHNAGTTDEYRIGIRDSVLSSGISGVSLQTNVVNRTWFIEEGVPGGSNASITLQWNTAEESPFFQRASSFIARYNGSAWAPLQGPGSATGGGPYSRRVDSVFSFSPFAVGDSASSLPIELLAFAARRTLNGDVHLHWTTATETNNHGFYLERRRNSDTWNTMGFIAGHGTTVSSSRYEWVDASAPDDIVYYRLKQVDHDGSIQYSPETMVDRFIPADGMALLQSYPNPFQQFTTLSFTLKTSQHVKLSILDASGKSVRTLVDGYHEAGRQSVLLYSHGLPPGVYMVRLEGRHKSLVRPLIVVR